MKKNPIILLAMCAALLSCGKDSLAPETESVVATPISFNLAANHPDEGTKAVKTGWESGDAIFVFFDNVAAPRHLKMTFDGTSWKSTEYDGDTPTPGALGLANGSSGSMRAVFLPFGNDLTVSVSEGRFVFSKVQYTYYLTATLNYTVCGNTVSGAFDMKIPADYVQFYIEDSEAVDEAYTLGCDAVIPTGIAYISSNGTIKETTDKEYSDDLPGYAYHDGYLFSGLILSTYYTTYYGNYYFAKTKVSDQSREDYFVSQFGLRLQSHDAVKLPANGSGSWQKVGETESVNLRSKTDQDLGTWFTCNYGETVPEGADENKRYSFSAATSITGTPTYDQLNNMIEKTQKNPVSIHGQWGYVFAGYTGTFLFIPGQYGTSGGILSCSEYTGNTSLVWDLEFNTNTAPSWATNPKYFTWPLRLLDTTTP